MNKVDNTCRTCGNGSECDDGSDLFPLYKSVEYGTELKMALEEFEIWNLNISENDGLPQKICLTCFDSFCQIHNFRVMCFEAQINYAEMCTGLDIIIKVDPDIAEQNSFDSFGNNSGDETIIVQEHFKFPGDDVKKVEKIVPQTDIAKNEVLYETYSDEERRKERDRLDEINAEPPVFKNYRCDFCMDVVSYEDPEQLNQHINDLHSTELPYPCPKCDKCFNTRAKRNSHARIHYQIVTECNKCSKKIRGGTLMMAQHDEYHHNEKDRQCPKCKRTFENISLKRFNYHMSWHDETKLRKCRFCDKKFIQTTHLAVHERTHTGEAPFMCSVCGMTFKNSGCMYKHIDTHGVKEIECHECHKKFSHASGLKLHMLKHNPNRKYPRCDICNKTYRSNMNLRLHNHKKHGGPATEAMIKVIKKAKKKTVYFKPYKCDKCPEEFVLSRQLEKHQRFHDEYRPFPCTLCSKSFKREAHLRIHVDALHRNKKPFKCTMCDWAFIQRNALNEHITAKHSGKKDFKCQVCSMDFSTPKTLKSHMLRHSDQKPFECTTCGRGFKQLCALKSHMNVHLSKIKTDVDI